MKTIIAIFAVLSAGISISAHAQWTPNGAGICVLPEAQSSPAAAPDGTGGLLVVWEDYRDYIPSQAYVQHLAANGTPLWDKDGVRACINSSEQHNPLVVSDGAGGAIVVWYTLGAPERIFGQHIGSNGSRLWGEEGIPLFTSPGLRDQSAVVSDGAGGAFVIFDLEDNYSDVYAQRVSGNGTLLWGNGVAVCAAYAQQVDARAIADGSGGVLIAFVDLSSSYGDIYAQRLNASGSPMWTSCGVPVCTAPGSQSDVVFLPDGGGGAILAWRDFRNGPSGVDIFAQSINAGGVAQWAQDGVPVCNVAGNQDRPVIASDGAGGAIIGWRDDRTDAADIYVQRINSGGSRLWNTNGVSLCSQPGSQTDMVMASDGAGGAIAVWMDSRTGANVFNIFAQRVQPSGALAWASDGFPVCTALNTQAGPAVVAGGSAGVFAVWDDARHGGISDIYGTLIGPSVSSVGNTPSLAPFALMPNVPNPFQNNTSFDLVLDNESKITIDVFDVSGRRVRHVGSMPAPRGRSSILFDGRDHAGNPLASGTYFFRVTSNAGQVTRKITILR